VSISAIDSIVDHSPHKGRVGGADATGLPSRNVA